MGELIQRQVQQVVTALRVYDHLRRVPQNPLERLDVQALARDARRLLIFREYLIEPLRLALRARGDLCAIGLGVLALVVLVLLVGTGYEAYSRHLARSEFPPNGRMIDVGGRRMHLDCRGQNEPTVVFEAGLDTLGSLAWSAVQDSVATFARACAYAIDLGAARFVPDFPFKPESFFSFDASTIGIGIGASLLACLLGAMLPARLAARVDPAAALQGG